MSRGHEPNTCISVAQSTVSTFPDAPKKVLGYFIDNLVRPTERTSRALLLGMCSFGLSQNPLASAECYKSAPHSLLHGKEKQLFYLTYSVFFFISNLLRKYDIPYSLGCIFSLHCITY